MVSAMLLSYLLLFFALTSSVTAQWDRLLHHRDSHLTEGNRYWYHMGRGKDKAKYPSWLLDHIFDDFIQFGTDADGVSTERRVSAISLFRLQRILQDPNKYCLHVSRMYNARTFHGPWKGNNGMGLKRNGFQMTGYWGRSTKLPVTAKNNNGRVIESSDIDVIIEIRWVTDAWKVRFPKIQADEFFTAPREYTLMEGVYQKMKEDERNALKQWQGLLHSTNPHLTHDVDEGYYLFRLMNVANTPSWPKHKEFDDVIELVPAGTPGFPAEQPGVAAISHLRLKRTFEAPNQYRLDLSSECLFEGPLGSRDELKLQVFWVLSTKKELLASKNKYDRVLSPSQLEVIIQIRQGKGPQMWEVRFPESGKIQANLLTTAPTVYTLPNDLAEKFRERKQLAEKPLGPHHGAGVLL